VKLGILETGEVHPDLKRLHGDYPTMFERLLAAVDPTLEFLVVRVVNGKMPASPTQADAWLVTGSRHGVYDDLPWIEPLKAFLKHCISAHIPVVGICFGHQILVEALGGRAAKSERGWGVGVHEYEVTARPGWMHDPPDRFAVGAMHQDQVVALPPDATVLARSPHCDYAAIAYGDPETPDAISLQPHPEFRPDFMNDLITLRTGSSFSTEVSERARATLTRPVDDRAWARLIVGFLHRAWASRAAA
jgi:GMP synthase-like glutamine amidotransferase